MTNEDGVAKVTLWYKQKLEYNHLENGWSEEDRPVGKFAEQRKSWSSGIWKRKHGYLIDGKVVERKGR